MPEARLQRKIAAFLEIFGLTDDQHAPMSAYSKGMRQKILISAALLHDPQILVLDEPNSGLDVTTSLVLRSLVRALAAEGRMVLYCSHVLEIVEQIATDVLILQDGRVAAHGSVGELRRMMASPTLEQVFRRLVVADGRRRPRADPDGRDEGMKSIPSGTHAGANVLWPVLRERGVAGRATGATRHLEPRRSWRARFHAWRFGSGARTSHAWHSSRANLFDAILRDQVLYVTYSMMALGFVAMLMWEGVFPDRRDARIARRPAAFHPDTCGGTAGRRSAHLRRCSASASICRRPWRTASSSLSTRPRPDRCALPRRT